MTNTTIDTLTAMDLTGESTDAEAERFAEQLSRELGIEYTEAYELVQDRRWQLQDWAHVAGMIAPADKVLVHPWTSDEELAEATRYHADYLSGDTESSRYERIYEAMRNLRGVQRAVYAETWIEDERAEELVYGHDDEGGLNRYVAAETTDAEIDLLVAGAEAMHGGAVRLLRDHLRDVRTQVQRGGDRKAGMPLRFYRRENYVPPVRKS